MIDGSRVALEVRGLCKQFGGVKAVDDCSFEAPRGQVTGLIGPNGAGKSTAIDLISGFKLPDSGSVVFDGKELQGRPPHQISRLGLVRTFQTPREWPALTVLENLLLARWDGKRETFWRAVRGRGRAGKAAADAEVDRAREILAEFQLTGLRNERAGKLSGGQKRLMEFARIRMAEPQLVILDEPMGGVNPVLGERMALAIESFVEAGTSVIVVEHNLPFIERVTDHVIVMAEGSVIATGSFESMRSNRAVIDAYLGEMLPEGARRASPPVGAASDVGARLASPSDGDAADERSGRADGDGAALRVEELVAGYGGPPIIDRVSVRARRGEITAVVGPNGAGKSTLLKAVAGLIRPTAGRVFVEGREVTGQPTEKLVRGGIAYVPQVANVFPELTVRENLEMGGYIRKSGVGDQIEKLYELFPDLRMASRRQANTLSGGQRTMLAMGRGLMVDPAVLILDEPSAGLSPRFQALIWERIEQVRAADVAVLIVEQNTRETLRHAQWAYVLTLGRNRLEGPGSDLLDDDEVVNLYVGRLG
jgi:branched-chain amino acid transport system ATP-binding protein